MKNTWARRHIGLGLVELMIAIAIGLIIMSGVIQLFITSTQNSVNDEAASRIQENIRYAMKRIGDDIARAGNMGCISFAAAGASQPIGGQTGGNANATLAGNAVSTQYINNRLATVTTGETSWNDFEGSFISGANGAANDDTVADTLIVKYIDSSQAIRIDGTGTNQLFLDPTAAVTVTTDSVAFAGDCSGLYIFNPRTAGVNVTTVDLPNAGAVSTESSEVVKDNGIAYFYLQDSGAYQYQIGNSSGGGNCDPVNTPTECSLYRVYNTGNPATQGLTEELVLGVSNLQIEYLDDDENAWRETPSESVATAANDLKTIDRIKVRLTFNAADTTQGDGILDRTVSRVFAVRNQL